MTAWAVLEVQGDQARVQAAPDPDELTAHLERLAPGWSLGWGCDQAGAGGYVVRARLALPEGPSREGLSQGPTLNDAKLAALADLARFFGVAAPGEGHWVAYDPDDGPDVSELEANSEPPAAPQMAGLPPEPPRDPQMDKARRHIEDLLEQLRAAGRGAEAARILMRGYGESVDESREIYRQLRGMLEP